MNYSLSTRGPGCCFVHLSDELHIPRKGSAALNVPSSEGISWNSVTPCWSLAVQLLRGSYAAFQLF